MPASFQRVCRTSYSGGRLARSASNSGNSSGATRAAAFLARPGGQRGHQIGVGSRRAQLDIAIEDEKFGPRRADYSVAFVGSRFDRVIARRRSAATRRETRRYRATSGSASRRPPGWISAVSRRASASGSPAAVRAPARIVSSAAGIEPPLIELDPDVVAVRSSLPTSHKMICRQKRLCSRPKPCSGQQIGRFAGKGQRSARAIFAADQERLRLAAFRAARARPASCLSPRTCWPKPAAAGGSRQPRCRARPSSRVIACGPVGIIGDRPWQKEAVELASR